MRADFDQLREWEAQALEAPPKDKMVTQMAKKKLAAEYARLAAIWAEQAASVDRELGVDPEPID